MEGNLRFKIGLPLQLDVNLPFLLCFTLHLKAIFLLHSPGGAYIWRGDLTEGFLRYRFEGLIMLGGLIHGGAYFRKFTVYSQRSQLEWHYPTLARANARFVFLVIIVITIFCYCCCCYHHFYALDSLRGADVQTLPTKDCKGPQTNMPKKVGSIKT